MKRMIVVGVGSLIMKDDGLGTRVAEAIQSELKQHDINVLIGETDVQYCFNEIHPEDFLIVVDAVLQGKEPGEFDIVPLRDAMNSLDKFYSPHDYSLLDAMSLNYPDIQGYFIGIEGAEIGFGFELSEVLGERFENICNDVFNEIIKMKEQAKNA